MTKKTTKRDAKKKAATREKAATETTAKKTAATKKAVKKTAATKKAVKKTAATKKAVKKTAATKKAVKKKAIKKKVKSEASTITSSKKDAPVETRTKASKAETRRGSSTLACSNNKLSPERSTVIRNDERNGFHSSTETRSTASTTLKNYPTRYSAVPPAYQFDQRNLLDPGAQIFVALTTEFQKHLADAAGQARTDALKQLLATLIGPKRRFKPARALVCWTGKLGQQLPPFAELTSGNGRLAKCINDKFAIGEMIAIVGVGDAEEVKLRFSSAQSRDQEADDDRKFSSIRVEYQVGSDGFNEMFPGLIWDLTPPISSRVTSVESSIGVGMQWRLDDSGRLFVPIQEMKLLDARVGLPEQSINIHCRIEPGEIRHLLSPRLNVSEIEEKVTKEVHFEIGPSTFETTVNRITGVSVEQPFAGTRAESEEDDKSWSQRAYNTIRHGSRAVTIQDYIDLAADLVPGARLSDVSPTRVPSEQGFADAVRLTIVPKEWNSLAELLSRSLVYAQQLEIALQEKTPIGVQVVAGPPSIRVATAPRCNDSLWLYREFLEASNRNEKVCRFDGVFWPLLDLADLRGER